jgi:hypothetical protein
MRSHLRGRLPTAVAAGVVGTFALAFTAFASVPAHAATPPIRHVWQIQLENEDESATYGASSVATYLNDTLKPEGVFLANYYATGHVSLDNYLSELSGEPGNVDTLADCQRYQDYTGDATDTSGSVNAGAGCVYPASVKTLPDQLTAVGDTWQGFMEDMGNTPTRETSTCGQPTVSGTSTAVNPAAIPPAADDTQDATASDQYAARHNPFIYFHSLIDVPQGSTMSACQANVKPLTQFAASLASPANYTWITPNLCNDGHDAPCAGPDITGANPGPGGLVSADAFLKVVVPQIMASAAYKQAGLIVITFDEGSDSDTASCCGEVTGTTGTQPAGGGGLIGTLLLSPLLTPHTSTVDYNHYSLLRSYEDLFGVTTGGADGKGHLGQAAVAPAFGDDVYETPSTDLPELPRGALLAVPVLIGLAAGATRRIRRRTSRPDN